MQWGFLCGFLDTGTSFLFYMFFNWEKKGWELDRVYLSLPWARSFPQFRNNAKGLDSISFERRQLTVPKWSKVAKNNLWKSCQCGNMNKWQFCLQMLRAPSNLHSLLSGTHPLTGLRSQRCCNTSRPGKWEVDPNITKKQCVLSLPWESVFLWGFPDTLLKVAHRRNSCHGIHVTAFQVSMILLTLWSHLSNRFMSKIRLEKIPL